MNTLLSWKMLNWLHSSGVQRLVVCSGSRNAPLLQCLEAHFLKDFVVESFFDERAAAFFALGMAKASEKPVAILTTSGTAVAECLPAVVEACYAMNPLIVVSADRPKRFRGSGSPQAIEQKNIFTDFCEDTFDVDSKDEFPDVFQPSAPLHFNLCLEEPNDMVISAEEIEECRKECGVQRPSEKLSDDGSTAELLKSFLYEEGGAKAIVVGALSALWRGPVEQFLKTIEDSLPIYCECTSNVHLEYSISEESLSSLNLQSILRLGDVLFSRYWRNLDRGLENVKVCSLSSSVYSGLARNSKHVQSTEFPADIDIDISKIEKSSWKNSQSKSSSYEKEMIESLSSLPSESSLVFLGNSLPIRMWNEWARRDSSQRVMASRGANGIDGQVACFLGASLVESRDEYWCVVGDLTFLYDMNALLLLQNEALKNRKIRILVLDNSGGKIFEKLPYFKKAGPQTKSWLVQDNFSVDYQKLVESLGMNYRSVKSAPECKTVSFPGLGPVLIHAQMLEDTSA